MKIDAWERRYDQRPAEPRDALYDIRAREAGNFDQTKVESPARNMHVLARAMPWLTQEPPRGRVF